MWWGLLSHVHTCVPKAHQKKISMVGDYTEGFEKPQHCQNWRVGDCPGQYGSTCSCCVWLSRQLCYKYITFNCLFSAFGLRTGSYGENCNEALDFTGADTLSIFVTGIHAVLQRMHAIGPAVPQCGNKAKLAVCTVTWHALTSCLTLMVAKEPNFFIEFKQCLTWSTAWL